MISDFFTGDLLNSRDKTGQLVKITHKNSVHRRYAVAKHISR